MCPGHPVENVIRERMEDRFREQLRAMQIEYVCLRDHASPLLLPDDRSRGNDRVSSWCMRLCSLKESEYEALFVIGCVDFIDPEESDTASSQVSKRGGHSPTHPRTPVFDHL